MTIKNGKLEVNGLTYNLVTIDFETYYADGFTLSGKLNMSEYVRDEQFKVHGVAIKVGKGKTHWYTGENIALALAEIEWEKTAFIGQNNAFDGLIVREHYGHVPAFYIDTLSMSRASRGHHVKHDLDTLARAFGHGGKVKRDALANTKNKRVLTDAEMRKLGAYAKDDVDDTYKVFWDLHPFIPDDELRLIDITMRMFCDPVLEIDIPRVTAELNKEVGAKDSALALSGAEASDLLSNEKFAELLRMENVVPPMKISPATGKPTYAFAKTDLEFQELSRHRSPKVRALYEARLRTKSSIGETRANRFLEAGRDGHKLPVLLNYSGAHTHRWSGGNKMNLQNLKRGGELRRSILAPKGHVIVVADSAQIEARVLAWLANQTDIVQAFAAAQDVYKMMAAAIYNLPVADITSDQRFIGKICVLGLGYGMGPQKLQQTLKQGTMGPPVDISEEECRRIVNIYRQKNWKIKQYWKEMDKAITSMTLGVEYATGPLRVGKGFVQLPNDMFLQYFGLHGEIEARRGDFAVTETTYLTRNGRSKLYGGLLTENIVQALSRVIIAEQMLRVHEAGYRIVTMTHDEIVIIAREEEADEALEKVLAIMATAPEWAPGLPLAAEGGYDTCYSK